MFHVKLHPQGVLGFQRKDQEKKGKKENKRIKRESGGGPGGTKKTMDTGGEKTKKNNGYGYGMRWTDRHRIIF